MPMITSMGPSWHVLLAGLTLVNGMETPTLKPTETPQICEKHGKGLFLPIGGVDQQEYNQPRALMAFAYFLGLVWLFLGVGIIADVFMGAIEVITSKEADVQTKDGPVKVKVRTLRPFASQIVAPSPKENPAQTVLSFQALHLRVHGDNRCGILLSQT